MAPLLHRHRTHPWTDGESHNYAVQAARRVADDILSNGRWGVADQPVYDVSDNGRYLGDLSDGTVRWRVGGPIISVFTPKLLSRDDLIESVYLKTIPSACRWERLVIVLTAVVETGLLTADEPIDKAATRLLRNGYDVDTLVGLLPDVEPVGATEIAERAGVERSTVEQWTRRYEDFPKPRWPVGGRPAWAWHEVRAWLKGTNRLPEHDG